MEVERSVRVLDGAVLVLDAVAGVEPQTETIWRQADRYGVPRVCFVNKMDRIGADFDACVGSLAAKLGARPLVLTRPLGSEADFRGCIDLLKGETLTWEQKDLGATVHRAAPAGDEVAALEQGREALLEVLADLDDQIAEAFLESAWPEATVVAAAIRRETLAGNLVPVLCGTALRNKGVQLVLDAVVDYLPSPLEVPPVHGVHPDTGDTEKRRPDPKAPFSALAFKIQQELGRRLTYVRVYSGTFTGGRMFNATRRRVEKPAAILRVHADKKERVDSAGPGDILAVTGLKWTVTGDTLCDQEHPLLLETIAFAKPVISMAVEPSRSQDEDKLVEALCRLAEEDPSFRQEINEETGQTLISGMGELHLEVLVRRLEEDYNVRVQVGKPQVVHKETVAGAGEGRALFDRVLGEKRHRAEVALRVSARERGVGNQVEFAPGLPELPPPLRDAARRGVEEALLSGVLEGNPVEDVAVKITAIDAGEDGSEMAIKVASNQAFREACQAAVAVLLQPVMKVRVTVPEDNVGEVIGDLNARKGEIQGMATERNLSEIDAMVPLHRMFGYSTDLRSLTQGRGTFTMSFHRYDHA